MTLVVPANQVEKLQKALISCGYGRGSVEGKRGKGLVMVGVYHDQLCSKREMVSFLKTEGINVL